MLKFVYPAYLFGLILCITPVVIYLLLRRRRREVPWCAGYLLRKTLETRRRSTLWRQYLVLALRLLFLALGAILVSQPLYVEQEPDLRVPAHPAGPVHRVILMDTSESMGVIAGGIRRMTRSKAAARNLLLAQLPGDRATTITLNGLGARDAIHSHDGPFRESGVDELLGSMQMAPARTALGPALTSALRAISTTPESYAELYIFSDFPREDLGENLLLDWFRRGTQERELRVVPVNVSEPLAQTPRAVALLRAGLDTSLLVARVPSNVIVRIANRSDDEVMAVLRLESPGIEPIERLLAMQANEEKDVLLGISFSTPGTRPLRLSVSPSPLERAARVRLAVEVLKQLKVWILADKPDITEKDALGEAEFIHRALGWPGRGTSPFKVEELRLHTLARPIPGSVDVIIIAGPRVINPAVEEPLRGFVRRGGGWSSQCHHLSIQLLHKNLGSILPCRLAGPLYEQVRPEVYSYARWVDSLPGKHWFAGLRMEKNGDIGVARFYDLMRVENNTAGTSVLLEVSSRAPLLVHRKLGRGHVFLFTSSLGTSWTSLPVHRAFIPFICRLVLAAASHRKFPRNISPGQDFMVPRPAKEQVVVSFRGQDSPAGMAETPRARFAMVYSSKKRGLYELGGESGHKEIFAVITEPDETDPRSVGPEQERRLAAGLGAPIFQDLSTAVKTLGPERATQPWWPWVILAALAIYVFETWFVRSL